MRSTSGVAVAGLSPTPPSKLNNSYYSAIAGQSPSLDTTIQGTSGFLDITLTPKLPRSPYQYCTTNLPPPPQFGNEPTTSSPLPAPRYNEIIGGSAMTENSNNNNGNQSQGRLPNTIPGNNPGNRLSFAHHQPLIFNDEAARGDGDRLTPSPTTHTLVVEEPSSEAPKADDYDFYERKYKNGAATKPAVTDPVKVSFV